jgi:hypothetical protein
LNFIGFKIKAEGWQCLGEGIEKSVSLKRFIIQNCNIGEKNHFSLVSKGLQKSKSVELIDFQCCDLGNQHGKDICSIIKEQFEMKDCLSWKFGLRNKKHMHIDSLGLKYINLARNNFDDEFVFELFETINLD